MALFLLGAQCVSLCAQLPLIASGAVVIQRRFLLFSASLLGKSGTCGKRRRLWFVEQMPLTDQISKLQASAISGGVQVSWTYRYVFGVPKP